MALFNKFFTHRKGTQNKHPDNVSEKLFAFSKDQVRVVLFRECDFRGRKLLFDSCSIKKVPIPQDRARAAKNENEDGEKFSEISDGFGYIYTKPQTDVGQLAEMVFGSVAMSFRGTYFKMHNLESPSRLMFTQVFPSPRYSNHNRTSNSSRRTSNQSLEHSVSNKLDDSGASSINSISEQLSVHSTTSDTILVCRGPHSTPLNVPNISNFMTSHSSMVGDSGYSADHSCISSEPSSRWNSIFDDHPVPFSSSSLYKRWLRSTSTSLDNNSLCSSVSAGEFSGKHHRSSKLGLAFLIQLTCGQEEALVQFFMEHVALVESVLWRARKVVELAFSKSQNFASLMVGMAQFSTQYLVSLLSGSYLSMNLWLSLMNGCDNSNSISAFSAAISDNNAKIFRSASTNVLDVVENNKEQFSCSHSEGLTSSFNGLTNKPADSVLDFTTLFKFLKSGEFDKNKSELSNEQRAIAAEKFVREFCELLEIIDVKDTNFFMSTLVTAVLTNHLGWVNTCLPSPDENINKGPFNPLWGELSDLYGAIGHPTKMAQTIITGTSRKDVISKILISLTYFIRCCDIDRRIPIRADIQTENKDIETICRNCSCIPKENFKKYEDHLREIMNPEFAKHEVPEEQIAQENGVVALGKGMVKTKTCLTSLTDFNENVSYPDLKTSEKLYPTFSKSMNGDKKLTRVPSSSMLCCLNGFEETFPSQLSNTEEKVVFVLGDNEKLVGLRKEVTTEKINDDEEIPQRPTFLDLSQKDNKFIDGDFQKNDANLIKPSTSWSLLNHQENTNCQKVEPECSHSNKYARSQSMPPEDRKSEKQETKTSKYRYSGVKFNLQQYPQILSNYMKSKNLEMTNLEFGDKGLKFDELSSINISTQYTELEGDYEDSEALQTPSNASELEFTSDLFIAPSTPQHAKESKESQLNSTFVKKQVPNTVVKEAVDKSKKSERKLSGQYKMKVVNFPMPKSVYSKPSLDHVKYTSSLMRAASDTYMPDMVLQGSTLPPQEWESKLKSDLILASQHSLIDQPLEEAVAVIANTDTWEVQLMSSHSFMIDKDSSGIRVGMSQLVANMLESLLQMWKLNVPPLHCLMHIEHTLQELFMQSKALAELLLATEFCSMEQLTSTLQLEVNDVPLLLAVASTHSPQVTHKYGLSFQ